MPRLTRILSCSLALVGLLALLPVAAHAQKKPNTDFKPNAPVRRTAPKPATTALAKENSTASDSLARKAKLELPLVLKQAESDGSSVTLPYELPYGGMVELRLYQGDSSGKLVFQENYIQNPGDNRIRLKAKAFKPGEPYTAILTYKGKRYSQRLGF